MTFDTVAVSFLETHDIDALPFGVVVMDVAGQVIGYNRFESKLSGLDPARVLGRHFFSAVAPCMNNFMVAQRLDDATELDETLSYVFTLRITPTPVRLRLLKSPGAAERYLLVERA